MNEDKSLDPRLRAKLKLLESVPERDPQAVSNGRTQFLSKAKTLGPPVSVNSDRRHNTWIPSKLKKKESRSMLTTLASIIVALTLAFGGAGATVYAAQDSLPNDFLYPVKTLSEDLQLALINDDLDELNMLQSFTQRRWGEINALLNKGEVVPPETITRLEYQIAAMFSLAAGLDDDEMQGALEQIRTMLQQGDKTLARTGQQDAIPEETLPEESLDVIEEAAKETLRNIRRVTNNEEEKDTQNAFRERFDSAENHPGEYPDKVPGAGTENGAHTGIIGTCDEAYLISIGIEDFDLGDEETKAAIAEVCECEGDPEMDIASDGCFLIPIWVWDGNGNYGDGGNGSDGSDGSGGNGK